MKTMNDRWLDLLFRVLACFWGTVAVGLGVAVAMRLNSVLKMISMAGKQFAQQ